MKACLLILAIFLFSNSFVNSDIKCSIYKCKSDLLPDQCATKEEKDAVVTFNLRECAGENPVCPFKSLSSSTTAVNCGKDIFHPVFPGGICTADTDCFKGSKCEGTTEKKCKSEKAVCEIHSDCEIGKVCIKDGENLACKDPIADDKPCTESYECTNGSACYKVDDTNSVCKKLFSIASGNKAPDAIFKDLVTDEIISFCKSGFRDSNQVCRELTLKEESAKKACATDADCDYEYTTPAQNGNEEFLQNGTESTKLAGSCDCSYSTGVSQCKLANSSKSLNDYITILSTKILADNQGACHTQERFDCKKVNDNKDLLKDYQTKKVNAIFEHQFKGAETCVKSVLFPYFQAPVVNKCPKFECKAEAGDTCGFSTGKLSVERKVTLNPCKKDNRCNFNTNDFFSENIDKTEQCEQIPKPVLNSLPGEVCDSNEDCAKVVIYNKEGQEVKDYQECDIPNRKCKGNTLGERCSTNESCVVGHYCKLSENPVDYKCTKQIDNDTTECKSTLDCKNNLICLQNKCKEPFTVAQGESVEGLDATTINFACSTGFYGPKKKCAQKFYGDKEKAKADKGLVKCDADSQCEYKILYKAASEGKPEESEIVTEQCSCGFNASGQGYCPYSYHDNDNLKRFQNINNNIKTSLNNSSHTVNRSLGFTDAKKNPYCKSYWTNVSYKNSVACAQDVLRFGVCEDVDKSDTTDPEPTSDDSSSTNTMMLKFSGVIGLIIAIALF